MMYFRSLGQAPSFILLTLQRPEKFHKIEKLSCKYRGCRNILNRVHVRSRFLFTGWGARKRGGRRSPMTFGGITRLSVGTERDQSPSAEHKGVYRELTAPAW